MNSDSQTKFLTLTFANELEDLSETNYLFNKFIKRLNYRLVKKINLPKTKYVATMDRKVEIGLKELVKNREISLRELARLSDMEPSIINKLANEKREKFICHTLKESLMLWKLTIFQKLSGSPKKNRL